VQFEERPAPEMRSVRVLVVDDYEPFRQFVCSTVGKIPGLQIVGQASDGVEAVRKAEELQPGLILMDIGLPSLSGIEAARRIRKLAPMSKVLFLSQETSRDVVQEALRLGESGYVVKAHAGSELLAAVEAVLQGEQFVSSGVANVFAEFTGARDPGCLSSKETFASPAPPLSQEARGSRCHEVQFYSDDASFLAGFTRFVEAALEAGNAVIVVATESHRNSLLQRLQVHGVDVFAAIEKGSYIPLDVADTLSTFMANDLPDPIRFLKIAGDLFAAAAKAVKGERPRVAACGECAPILWAQGRADAAIQLEHLWDEIAKTCDVDILCGYVLNSCQREQESHIYERICAEHSAVCFL
jgi:DNA-binding NarL/FixJ family response regulator